MVILERQADRFRLSVLNQLLVAAEYSNEGSSSSYSISRSNWTGDFDANLLLSLYVALFNY